MPQVSAAALQPSVPIQKDPGGAYQNIPGATPEAFGAGIGQAQQGLGQTLEHASNVLMEDALQRQNFANQVATDKARNDFQDFTIAQSYGNDQTPGYHATRGADAVTQFPDYRDALKNERERIRGTLTNETQKVNFDRETRTIMAGHLEQAGRHRDQQMKVDAIATNKATDALAQTSITSSALNNDSFDASFDKAVEDKINANIKTVQASGGGNDPKQIWAAMSQAREEAVLGWVSAKSTQNPKRALEVLEANQSIVDPLKYAHLHNTLEHQQKSHAGQQLGDQIYSGGVPVAGQAGAPYTPATNLLSGTGLSAAQYNAYREALAAPESGGDYTKVNAGGYAGRYQLGAKEREETAKRMDIPTPSLEQFRNDPQLQEKMFENYTLDHHNQLMANPAYANASPQRKAAILAGAHLGGVEGVNAYLSTGEDRQDANKTRVSSYINRMTRAMGGTGGTAPTAPAGAPAAAAMPATTGASGPIEVWGDSLGVGLKRQLKGPGTAVGGATPTAIFDNIKKQPDSYWQGKTVALPSGSNGNEMPVVEETIKYLQGKGARVIAVGYGPKFPEKNAQLRDIAQRNNVPVIDAEGVGATEGVHPSPQGYQSMAQKISAAATQAPAAATTEPPATSGGSGAATQVAPADAGGGGAPTPATGLAPLPDVEQMLQRVDDLVARGEIEPDVGDRARSQIRSRFNQDQARQSNDRAALHRKIGNDVTALMDGKENVDAPSPEEIRHYFPKQNADEYIQQLDDARDGGRLIASMRTASPEQLAQQRAELQKGVDEPGAPDYAKRSKMLALFDQTLKRQQTALWGHTESDPVAYLANFNLPFQHARNVATARGATPQDHETYATLAASEQTRMGVPVDEQHLITVTDAQAWAKAIGSNPEQAPRAMQTLAQQWGQAWPQVWADLITLGKLPAAYQVVGQLSDYDPGNAAILSRTLGAQVKDDSGFEKSIGRKVSGGKSIKQIVADAVEGSEAVQAYEHSLRGQNASEEQVVAIPQAIEHLAAGRALYLSEDPTEATTKAIDAVVGKFRFMPNGGARVPATRYDDVSSNAQDTINGLSVANTLVPDVHWMGPTATPPQDYIDELKARHVWATGGKSDRAVLYDHGGRLVRDRNGNKIEVLFSDGPKVQRPAGPPLPGTYDPYAPTP